MGLISDYLKYRKLKKHYKKLYDWQLSLIEAGLSLVPPVFTPIPKGNTMSDINKTRKLHRILDRLLDRNVLDSCDIAQLRAALPELPKKKTLEEIAWDIDFARAETSVNDWKEELFGDLEAWLTEQHTQLRAHLEGVKSEAHPEFLVTEADYANAPVGTIVVADGGVPCQKFQSTWSSVAFLAMKDDRGMSRARRRVLRWGK